MAQEASTDNDAQPAFEPSATAGIGIKGAGITVTGCRIEGFETGLEVENSTIKNTLILRHQRGGANFQTDGRFSTLSNSELKSKATDYAQALRELNSKFEKIIKNDSAQVLQILALRDQEYDNNSECLANLSGEILKRTGNIEILHMSPIYYGGLIVCERQLNGADPINFVSYFLDHIVGNLPSDNIPYTKHIPLASKVPVMASGQKSEIFGLRPAFMGMSIDLRAVWQRCAPYVKRKTARLSKSLTG